MEYKLPSLDSFKKDSIKLDWNEGSENLIKTLDFVDLKRLKNYPILESSELKNTILKKNNIGNKDLDIILTTGSDEFIFRLLVSLKKEIEHLYFIKPSYTQILSDSHNLGYNVIELYSDPFQDISIGLFDDISPDVRGLFYICTPNNPTGRIVDSKIIKDLAHKFSNSIFIVDEAYIDFCENLSAIKLSECCSNLIFIRTFSKAYSLAGLRVGYGIYNTKRLPDLYKYFNPKSISLLSSVICKRAIDLNLSETYVNEVEDFKVFLKDLNNPNIFFNEGNFFLYKPKCGVTKYLQKLKQNKIYVRNRSDMYGLAGFVRISISDFNTMMDNIDLILEKE
jgi:histidinol-phosphate aminotransferase